MKLARVISAAAALACSSNAYAQGNAAPWGLDSTTSPHPLNLYADSGWQIFGKVASSGGNLNITWPGTATFSAAATFNSTVSVAGAATFAAGISTTYARANSSSAGDVSTNLGPSGLNWIPFDAFATIDYSRYAVPATHPGYALSANASIINTPGSGAFGPATADIAHLFSASKNSFLTSSVDGELDTTICISRQGKLGDTGCYIADVEKVKDGAGTGGASAAELRAAWVDSTETVLNDVHSLPAFMESSAGVSGGAGYGWYTDSWKGTNYSGVYVGNYLGNDPTTGWQYAFIAASDRTTASQYFRIVGNKVSGSHVAGEIIQGITGNSKIIRTNSSGTLQVRNDANSSTLFSITDAGVVTAPFGAQLGGTATTACSGLMACIHNTGDQNVAFYANVNSGSAMTSVNDAGAAYVPMTVNGSTTYLQAGGVNIVTVGASTITAAKPVLLQTYTVATLPTCNAGMKGGIAYVTDASGPTYNAALVGGGAVVTIAFCSGASWTAH